MGQGEIRWATHDGTRVAALGVAGVALFLAGCGGGGGTRSSGPGVATVTQVSAPDAAAVASSEPIVTVTGGTPITKADLEHWVGVTDGFQASKGKINGKRAPKPQVPKPPYYSACIAGIHRRSPGQSNASMKAQCEAKYVQLEREALGYLITTDWVRAEAAQLHLTVSHREVITRLHGELSAPGAAKYEGLLAYVGETTSDAAWRTEGELLRSRIAESVTRGKTLTTEARVLLGDYQEEFKARWKSRTICRPGYVIEDCMQFKTPPPATTPEQREERTYQEEKKELEKEGKENEKKLAKHEATTSKPGRPATPGVRGGMEEYNTPGGMSLTSPAFEINGQIPVAYTCEGAGISPPLHWSRIPSGAGSLALMVMYDPRASFGGVNWIVANINPGSTGVAAGQVPEGAVVGKGSGGKAGYQPICPEKGKTDEIEFLLYAFKNKFNLKPGFTENELRGEYLGPHGDYSVKLSEHATFYGVYSRP